MSRVLLDTHVWAWSLRDEERLSKAAVDAMATAENIFVSPISFYEITQKVNLGKWPQMADLAKSLETLLVLQGGKVQPFTAGTAVDAGLLQWSNRDPFDRMIAATAMALDRILISADSAFDGLPLRRVW